MNPDSRRYAQHHERANKLMLHYFRQVYQRAGIPVDQDMVVELADLVDSIIEAATAAALVEIRAEQPPSNPYRLPTD